MKTVNPKRYQSQGNTVPSLCAQEGVETKRIRSVSAQHPMWDEEIVHAKEKSLEKTCNQLRCGKSLKSRFEEKSSQKKLPNNGESPKLTFGQRREKESSMSDIEKAWLAGIIDGEGCISLARQKNRSGRLFLRPSIHIGNTNPHILFKAREICEEILNKSLHVCSRIPKSLSIIDSGYSKTNGIITPQYRRNYAFHLTNQRDISIILIELFPYLIGKKPQAQLMLKWIWERLNSVMRSKDPYSLEFGEKMRNLNHRSFPLVTTARETRKPGRYAKKAQSELREYIKTKNVTEMFTSSSLN